MPNATIVQRLAALLARVRLHLEPVSGGFVVGYERERYELPSLPLDGIDRDAVRGEIMAIAAGIDAAIKVPGELARDTETLREGAATLLPKIERTRWVDAYNAVVATRGEGDGAYVFARELGAGLSAIYVEDQGFRFMPIIRDRVKLWGASGDTIHSLSRSNLYARAELDHRADAVALADGYDAARAVLMEDVFYDRDGGDGIELAIPGRDQLLIGPGLDPAVVRAAYDAAPYPVSPVVLSFAQHRLRRRDAHVM